MRDMVVSHLSDESGAVSVDWVVMSAGLVGLGLATMAVVTAGVEDLSTDTSDMMAGTRLTSFFTGMRDIAAFDFTGGMADGWIGGQVMDMGGVLGELLVVGPNQTVGFLVDVPPGSTMATMAFDLIGGDSLDAGGQWGTDSATVMINGVPVAIALSSNNGPIQFDIPQLDGTSVEAVITVENGHLGGNANFNDATALVTVAVSNPTGDLQFALQSSANQGVQDEYWAIDNFEASADR